MTGRVARWSAAFALALAAPANADFPSGATVVSASLERQELADDNTLAVAVSGDGRYAAVHTRGRNLFPDDVSEPEGLYYAGALFRRDIAGGALELVALGDLRSEAEDTTVVRGAQSPSISAEGRFVAFSTAEALVPADTNDNIDVYVRDMAVARDDPTAYELVSARDLGDVPARYGAPATPLPGLNPGAEVTRHAGMSSDGRYVVFRTFDVSDLPAEAEVATPAQQVFIRDRVAKRTTLVTRRVDDGAPAGGAIGPAGVSGDGTTVVWSGREAPAQTRFLANEGQNPSYEYYLWRRVADGEQAPTRRITGQVDPDDPACPPGFPVQDDPNVQGPCYGPLAQHEGFAGGIVNQLPGISRDGYTLAFLTSASPRGQITGGIGLDLFVTSMAPGRTRKEATVELTREAQGSQGVNAPLEALALSDDARWAVVSTVRNQFALPALRQLTPPRQDTSARELFLVDLQARTIEQVLHAYDGTPTNGSVALTPSVSADGRRIGFLSSASNLFFGDANERIDGFAIDRLDPVAAAEPPPPVEEPPLPPPVPATELPEAETPRLRVSARRAPKLAVRLAVRAPSAGRIRVTVRGRVPDAEGRLRGRARVLGRATARARRASTMVVTVRLSKRYRSAARRAGSMSASATAEFSADGQSVERRISVVFRG